MPKNRKVFLSILFISFVFAVLAGGKLPYLIFRFLLFTLMVSYISVYKNYKNLSTFFSMDKQTAQVGDEIKLEYSVNNTGLLPVAYAEIDCNITSKLGNIDVPVEVSFIKPLQILNISKSIQCKNKGFYPVGKFTIKIRDILHLFERQIDIDNQLELEVYPKIVELTDMSIPAAEFFGSVRVAHNTYEDYTSIENVRKYAQGDSVRKIHWKVSAKMNDLYVKNYELAANTRVNVFVDGCEKHYFQDKEGLYEERVVEVAGSIIRYCLMNNLSSSLISQREERSFIEGRDMSKFNAFLKELIRFTPNSEVPFEDFLKVESRMLPWGATLVIISRKLTEALFHEVLSLKKKRFNIMLILVEDNEANYGSEEVNHEAILRKTKISLYKMGLDSDIREVLGA